MDLEHSWGASGGPRGTRVEVQFKKWFFIFFPPQWLLLFTINLHSVIFSSLRKEGRVVAVHRQIVASNHNSQHFPPTCTCLGLFETRMAAHYIIESARSPWFCEKIDRKQSKRKQELSSFFFFFHFLRNRDEGSGCQRPFRRGFRFPICHPIAAWGQKPLVGKVPLRQ